MKIIYIGMSLDFIHHGHINILKKSKKYGSLIVGLMTDRGIKSYKKKLPFRSFEIKKRNEKTLGELFCFFILETILIGKLLNVNPYDQPAVELIKKETKKIII